MSLRVNIDSDDVVYNLSAELLDRANRRWGKDFETFPTWEIGKTYGVTDQEVRDFFEAETKNRLYALGHPIDGAPQAIRTLAEQGHDLRIVTHKHGMGTNKGLGMMDMIDWYDTWGLLDLVDIVIARGDKTQYPADVVIDDKPTCAWAQPGALNVLFAQPWNEGPFLVPGGPWARVMRVDGWADVLAQIELEVRMKI